MCIRDTRILQTDESWGNLSFVELSNNCLDPAAQFRFRDNSAMFNLKRKGCFEGTKRGGTGYHLPMLYMLLATNPKHNCVQKHAITQTSWGGLSVIYKSQTWCAVPGKDYRLTNKGINPYIKLTPNCNYAEDKRFNFGKFLGYISFPSEIKAAVVAIKSSTAGASGDDNRKLWCIRYSNLKIYKHNFDVSSEDTS